jgi:DNA invertase Pin-like site-specific DNA recombinase
MKIGYLWTYGSEDALAQMRKRLRAAGCEKIFEDTQEPSTFEERKLLQQALAEVTTGDRLVVYELAALGGMRDVLEVSAQIVRVGAGLQVIRDDIDSLAPGGSVFFRALKAFSALDGTLRGKAVKARNAAAKNSRGKE